MILVIDNYDSFTYNLLRAFLELTQVSLRIRLSSRALLLSSRALLLSSRAKRGICISFLAATAVTSSAAQTVVVRNPGPARSGADVLRAILAQNPEIIRSDTGTVDLARGARHERPVLIIAPGYGARVHSTISGDIVVVGGDLFVHPGAIIEGAAVAIGGGVYPSTLALIRGGTSAFRDGTFVPTDTPAGTALDYQPLIETYTPPLLTLPIFYGARIPSYDRVDGVSATWGPFLQPHRAIGIDPMVTYRSHRGAFDPALRIAVELGGGWRGRLEAAHETRSNDLWIRGTLSNSISALITGSDARNYYRARGIEGRISRGIELNGGTIEPFVGVMHERASAAINPFVPLAEAPGNPIAPRRVPWSLRGESDAEEGMRRSNPFVPDDRVSSGIAGFVMQLERAGVTSNLDVRVEAPWEVQSGPRFTQFTIDGRVAFRTFGPQSFRFEYHWLKTTQAIAPPQRWSYVGGSGTLPTFELLEMGGDEVLFLESRYMIPLNRIKVPMLGSPTFALRHMIGSAGRGTLPALEQNLAVRLQLMVLRAEVAVDPRTREKHISAGLTLSR